MTELGIVKRSEITTELDGDGNTRVLQVELSGTDDIQNCELYRAPGDDSRPVNGTRVAVQSIGPASKIAIAAVDVAPVDLKEGERELYSIDENGARSATYRLKKDGSHVFNAGTDWAVQFTAMQAAFDNLKSELNSLVTKYNAHIHVTTATIGATPALGVITPTTSQGIPPVADMSAAKVNDVRIP